MTPIEKRFILAVAVAVALVLALVGWISSSHAASCQQSGNVVANAIGSGVRPSAAAWQDLVRDCAPPPVYVSASTGASGWVSVTATCPAGYHVAAASPVVVGGWSGWSQLLGTVGLGDPTATAYAWLAADATSFTLEVRCEATP